MSTPIVALFNFKREGQDDLKILNIPFHDRSTADQEYSFSISMFAGTLKERLSMGDHTKRMHKLLKSFSESYEVRVKIDFSSTLFAYQSRNQVFNMKVDLTDFDEM